jgi:hypothetical protein
VGRDEDVIELASVIRDLRAELQYAVAAADGEALRFELGPIELEVAVAVERSAKAGGKLRFWVVEAHADGELDATRTQRIKLALTPRLADGAATPYVFGNAMPGEDVG